TGRWSASARRRRISLAWAEGEFRVTSGLSNAANTDRRSALEAASPGSRRATLSPGPRRNPLSLLTLSLMAGVRKVVTIVFSDIVASTRLGERLDPEMLLVVISRYFDAMEAALERHGGSVEKFVGDAIMAVFGLPTLHEDDALRAVRAAVEMRSALAGLNAE